MTQTTAARGRKPAPWRQVAPAGLLAAAVLAGQAVAEPDAGKRSRAPAPIVFASMSGKSANLDRTPLVLERGLSAATARAQNPERAEASTVPVSFSSAPAFDATAGRPTRPGSKRLAGPGEAEPYAGPPYQVEGRWFVPAHEPDYNETGIASWYGPGFHGKATASGEIFDQDALTAAHPTLPIPSLAKVTNLSNGRTVVVRLNDRGPYKNDRIIDLSKGAAEALGVTATGTAKVRVQYVGPAPEEPNSIPGDVRKDVSLDPVNVADRAAELLAGTGPQEVARRGEPLVRSETMAPITLPAAWPEDRPDTASSLKAATGSAPPQPAAIGALYLQAGAFADLANAHRLKDRIDSLGAAQVSSLQSSKGELYRVVLGPWADANERNRVQIELEAMGIHAFAARAP